MRTSAEALLKAVSLALLSLAFGLTATILYGRLDPTVFLVGLMFGALIASAVALSLGGGEDFVWR